MIRKTARGHRRSHKGRSQTGHSSLSKGRKKIRSQCKRQHSRGSPDHNKNQRPPPAGLRPPAVLMEQRSPLRNQALHSPRLPNSFVKWRRCCGRLARNSSQIPRLENRAPNLNPERHHQMSLWQNRSRVKANQGKAKRVKLRMERRPRQTSTIWMGNCNSKPGAIGVGFRVNSVPRFCKGLEKSHTRNTRSESNPISMKLRSRSNEPIWNPTLFLAVYPNRPHDLCTSGRCG